MSYHPTIFPLLLLVLIGTASAAERRPSVTRGVDFIYASMNSSGHWEVAGAPEPLKPTDHPALVTNTNYTGRSALALYSLISCGEKAIDPRLEKAINLLKDTPPPPGTYALSFRCLAFASMPQTPEIRKALIRDSKALLANATARGSASYSRQSREQPDASNSQVLILALSAASDCGFDVPSRHFSNTENSWHAAQLPDGAWCYAPAQKENRAFTSAHPGMTAAGVATLLLIADEQASASAPRDKQDPHVEKAMAWLSANFDTFFDFDFHGDRSLYALYALERVGVAGGIKRFGTQSWFDRGTQYLESRQNGQGAWTIGVDGSTDATVCSAFALLFLTHADAPAAINKLRYTTDGDDAASPSWNGRHRDVSRLTTWMASQTEQKLRWQVVDLSTPTDLDDAPVLYVSGTKPPKLSDDDIASLKAYVGRGGLIVFAPETGAKPFADAARALGTRMFPDCEWRTLPDEHPLFTQQQFKAAGWKEAPGLQGLSNGTREFVLLLDTDTSRIWQAGATPRTAPLFELGADIVQYTGNPVRRLANAPPVATAAPAVEINIARVNMQREEPQAWPMLCANLAAHASTALKVTTIDVGAAIPAGVKLLHIPVGGSEGFRNASVEQLRAFTDAGGTVLIEAVGGSATAIDDINQLVARGWPEAENMPVPDAILKAVQLRLGAVLDKNRGDPLVMRKVGAGRLVISRVDLSAGWAGLHHGSIAGMTPESATAVMKLLLNP